MQEVCRCLDVDLTGQTSASYNMRLNYEKCLLEFEMYLASGQYEVDLSVGNAPSPDEITYTNTKREVMNTYMPPPVMSLSSAPSSAGPSVGTMTLRERAPRCKRPTLPTGADDDGPCALCMGHAWTASSRRARMQLAHIDSSMMLCILC